MRIGHPSWKWVSTDTAGVPHGGKYGDVAAFERDANRHGLKVAWSWIHHAFAIYSEPRPGKVVCQYWAMRTGGPMPLTRKFLAYLLYNWERFARRGMKNLTEEISRNAREYEERQKRERVLQDQYMLRDLARAVALRRKKATPRLWIPVGRRPVSLAR